MMLKSCQYCGRIHDKQYDCGKRPRKRFERTQAGDFRGTNAWQKKRTEIMERDWNLCRMSLSQGIIDYTDLSVHHIEPLREAYDRRLDDYNLITLNGRFHELAEAGEIDRALLHELARTPPDLAGT